MKSGSVKVYCDGGSRGNPGPSAAGVVIKSTKAEIIEEFGKFLGHQTNNFAEYTAVILALQKLHELNLKSAQFYLDSELIVRQLNGQYKVKSPAIKDLYDQVQDHLSGISASFTHVYREDNTEADSLVNQTLDSQKA